MPYRILYIVLAVLAATTYAHAQSRSFFNGGFEANDPQGPGNPRFQIFPDTQVPDWFDQTGDIELWDSNFLGVPAFEGDVLAEMNAFAPGTLYQEVCMVAGEDIGWSFAHRSRDGGPQPQSANLEIADTSGNLVQTLATQTSVVADGWNVNTGSTVYTGPSGTHRIQFRTTNPGSLGNLVDAMRLDVTAFAQLDVPSSQDFEASGANVPEIVINGTIATAVSIPVTVIGGTADASDFTLTASAVTIPAGTYQSVGFPLPLSIVEDSIGEPDETIVFRLGTPSNTGLEVRRLECDGQPPVTETTYTIVNEDAQLEAEKTVEPVNTGPGEYSIPGEEVFYTIRVRNTGLVPVDPDTLFLVDVLPPEMQVFTGDIAAPGAGAVVFTQTNSALTWSAATDLGYAQAGPQPQGFADCGYAPAAPYDASVAYICFAPSGTLGTGSPEPEFSVRFKMLIP